MTWTWWTLQVSGLFSWVAVILMTIPVAAIAMYLGRIMQRWYWHLDKPYSERVKGLEKK